MQDDKSMVQVVGDVIKSTFSIVLFYFAVFAACYNVYKLIIHGYRDTAEMILFLVAACLCILFVIRNIPKRPELRFIYVMICILITYALCKHSYRIESDVIIYVRESKVYEGKEIVHGGEFGHEVTLRCSKCRKCKSIPTFYSPKEYLG